MSWSRRRSSARSCRRPGRRLDLLAVQLEHANAAVGRAFERHRLAEQIRVRKPQLVRRPAAHRVAGDDGASRVEPVRRARAHARPTRSPVSDLSKYQPSGPSPSVVAQIECRSWHSCCSRCGSSAPYWLRLTPSECSTQVSGVALVQRDMARHVDGIGLHPAQVVGQQVAARATDAGLATTPCPRCSRETYQRLL